MFCQIIWEPDPTIFSITKDIKVTYYGLFYVLSYLFGCFLITKLDKSTGKVDLVFQVGLLAIFSIVFGRVGFLLFYENPHSSNYILSIWKGGNSSHGALIGIFVLAFVLSCSTKHHLLLFMDRFLILSVLAGCLIRIGNFYNSEKFGKITNVPWAVIFGTNTLADIYPRHPTQLYEAMFCFLLFVIVLFSYKNRLSERVGIATGFILTFLFGFRFINMLLWGDNVTSIEQILNITTTCLGLLILLFSINKQLKKAFHG